MKQVNIKPSCVGRLDEFDVEFDVEFEISATFRMIVEIVRREVMFREWDEWDQKSEHLRRARFDRLINEANKYDE